MKIEVGASSEDVMNGVSKSDGRRLGGMGFWVEDDLDGSGIVGVEEDKIDSVVLLDISVDIFSRVS